MKRTLAVLLTVAVLLGSFNLAPSVVKAEEYVTPASLITDIEGHWAEQPIYALINQGILSGYDDNTFKPNNQITRSEYMAALFKTVCILDESISSEESVFELRDFYFYGYRSNERKVFAEKNAALDYELPYQDLQNHWSKNSVAWVKNYVDQKYPGMFAEVFSGEKFYPNQAITREEAAVVTVAFLAPSVTSKNVQFKDIAADYEFSKEITALIDNEIISGFPDGTFRPQEKITRAATAVIMNSVLKEAAYNMDFFSSSDTYMQVIGSSSDGDYIPSFLAEELYENPATEEDKKYVAYFKAYITDRSMAQELMGVQIYNDLESQGLEPGTEEYYQAIEKLENEIIEKYEQLKLQEIPYYTESKDQLKVLKELEEQDYWNKAGLYYWLYRLGEEQTIEYLEKAEQAYDADKNGKDDLFYLYNAFVDYYLERENSSKVKEYISKTLDLYVPNEYGEEIVADIDIQRFYLFAAFDLARVGEYAQALDYVNKYMAKGDEVFSEYIALQKGALMYLTGQTDEAIEYLKENLNTLEQEEYLDENLRTKYIWAIKTIMRHK